MISPRIHLNRICSSIAFLPVHPKPPSSQMHASPAITLPIQIRMPELWGADEFTNETWWPVNFLVGGNGTGKTRFAEHLTRQLPSILNRLNLKSRFLGAERLAGLEKGNVWQYPGGLHRGLDISNLDQFRQIGADEGRGADAFIILKRKLDVRIRLEALLLSFFKRRLRLAEEGGYLMPKLQQVHGGSEEYSFKESECHGLKELIALLAFIYDDEFNCLIIDEPELNLHPQFQSFLLGEIRRLAGNPLTQPGRKMFFLITHSPYMLDFRSIEDLRSLLLFQPGKVPRKLGTLSQDEEYNLRRLLPRLNTHHKQFFFASRPVFVEGYRDQQLFTLIQERRRRPPGITGACFIDVNGKDEQFLYYCLCQQYGLEGQFICDLDALTSGKLRNAFFDNPALSETLSKEGLGTSLRDALTQFWQKLDALGVALAGTTEAAHEELRSAIAQASTDTKRHRLLLLLSHQQDGLKQALPGHVQEITFVISRLAKLRAACAGAGFHLLPHGALENHCPAFMDKPWEISENAKAACFDKERDFLFATEDVPQVEERFAALIPVLNAAQGDACLDLDRHLGHVIGDWIAVVQSGVQRGEITGVTTLQSHALVQWNAHLRIFELVSFEVTPAGFYGRFKLTKIVDENQREFTVNQDTRHAGFQLP